MNVLARQTYDVYIAFVPLLSRFARSLRSSCTSVLNCNAQHEFGQTQSNYPVKRALQYPTGCKPVPSKNASHQPRRASRLSKQPDTSSVSHQKMPKPGKLDPNKAPPIPEHLKATIGEIEEGDTPIKPEHFHVENGLQFVLPYHFDFRLNVKKRMVGMPVVDLFTREFPVRSREYYEAAYIEGRLRVEGDLDPQGGLRPGQCLRHFVHRHEPPVPAGEVEVLAETEDIVAVNKPAAVPVHVAGQYRKNTVVGILEAFRPDLGKLSPSHRLDKPVSGVLLLTRHPNAAEEMRARITDREVSKGYVARVEGTFMHESITVTAPLLWDHRSNRGFAVDPSANSEQHPSATPSETPEATTPQPSAEAKTSDAKSAETLFEVMRVDKDSGTSLVRCWPKTGRTHQLRIHLAHLGHPIANDRLYGGLRGPKRPEYDLRKKAAAENAAPAEPSVQNVPEKVPLEADVNIACGTDPPPAKAAKLEKNAEGTQNSDYVNTRNPTEPCTLAQNSTSAAGAAEEKTSTSVGAPENNTFCGGATPLNDLEKAALEARVPDEFIDHLCAHCPQLCPRNYPLDLEPLWLHAERYECVDWSFRAPLPKWADESFSPGEKLEFSSVDGVRAGD